ncbi:MAG: NAD(P)-binding protein [Roseomonas sp.]|nr:NAD(P)-binding protein [Roseomonas sp.]
MSPDRTLPVVIIGGGPVGLAAAANLIERGLRPRVFEAGSEPGAAVREWGHVRMFSPWRFNVDAAARRLLEAKGWKAPDMGAFPTGADLLDLYVAPLAAALAAAGADLSYNAKVIGVSRRHHDRLHEGQRAAGRGRDTAPFVLHIAAPDGTIQVVEANAVIDCSGTWFSPNPAGAHGLPAPGEAANADRIAYGIPDVLGISRSTYAGATTLVLGSGHSAMNAVFDLAALAKKAPGTRILWAFRRPLADVNFGGGDADGLAARGALGAQAQALVASRQVEALAPFLVHRIGRVNDRLLVLGDRGGSADALLTDRIIVATGFRPDLSWLGELRVALDPAVQATPSLAPLIDPNLHSCGTVRPHGEAELRHPDEPGFYMAGMKAYGRAPTFLLATGHEQVRSIAAHLAGDIAAARRVELLLPETGVCSTQRHTSASTATGGCCGPSSASEPARKPIATAACCGSTPREESRQSP